MSRIAGIVTLGLALTLLAAGCGDGVNKEPVAVPGHAGVTKTAASVRALRRAYDGAPPMIPHKNFGMTCTACHKKEGVNLPGVGFSPPMPHVKTPGLSAVSNCKQCHLFAETDTVFRDNVFVGLRQDLRRGKRLFNGAPPVMPHMTQMHENCSACHDGPAAREEIRCTHPERDRCTQCHVPQNTKSLFTRE